MQNGKVEGVHVITAKMFKNLGKKAMKELTTICQEIYETDKWPDEFTTKIFITQ